MSPSPNQQQGRYRSMAQGGGMPQPQGVMPAGGPPTGGPPSFTGGTPSGSQPMGAGMQQAAQRMPAPWAPQGATGAPAPMGDAASPEAQNPRGMRGMNSRPQLGHPHPIGPQGGFAPQGQPGGRMPAPWAPTAAGNPQPGQQNPDLQNKTF